MSDQLSIGIDIGSTWVKAVACTPDGAVAHECRRCLEADLVLPAYDQVLKCSHAFNLLDARGVISVTERGAYIWRVRALAAQCARAYLELVAPAPEPVSGAADA